MLDWLITRSILILTSQRFKPGGARYRLRDAGLDLLRFQIWFHAMNRCLDFSKGLGLCLRVETDRVPAVVREADGLR